MDSLSVSTGSAADAPGDEPRREDPTSPHASRFRREVQEASMQHQPFQLKPSVGAWLGGYPCAERRRPPVAPPVAPAAAPGAGEEAEAAAAKDAAREAATASTCDPSTETSEQVLDG